MGLLDDAIREHMELKRLRGADPSEVARQERDALGPVVREPDEETALEDPDDELQESNPRGEAFGEDDPSEDPHTTRGANFADVGQETAEIDMRTVLDEQLEEDLTDHDPPVELAGGPGPDDDGEPVDDVLEETPDFLRDTPEQERLWFEQQPPRDFDFDK
jgi:hypothetical protein